VEDWIIALLVVGVMLVIALKCAISSRSAD
jgi:hypothetical protein